MEIRIQLQSGLPIVICYLRISNVLNAKVIVGIFQHKLFDLKRAIVHHV